MATVFDRVRDVVIHKLGINEDRVVPAATFLVDLEADSLDLLEVIIGIEEEFAGEYDSGGKSFEITDEQAKRIVTLQDAVTYLQSMGIRDR